MTRERTEDVLFGEETKLAQDHWDRPPTQEELNKAFWYFEYNYLDTAGAINHTYLEHKSGKRQLAEDDIGAVKACTKRLLRDGLITHSQAYGLMAEICEIVSDALRQNNEQEAIDINKIALGYFALSAKLTSERVSIKI